MIYLEYVAIPVVKKEVFNTYQIWWKIGVLVVASKTAEWSLFIRSVTLNTSNVIFLGIKAIIIYFVPCLICNKCIFNSGHLENRYNTELHIWYMCNYFMYIKKISRNSIRGFLNFSNNVGRAWNNI